MDYRERWELKEYRRGRRLRQRISLFHGVLAVAVGIFLFNFWYLQIVRGDRYEHLAEGNRLRRVPMMALRGVIYDRNGQILAATRPALSLYLRREKAKGVRGQLERLAPVLGMPREWVDLKLRETDGQPSFRPLLVKENVNLRELARIESRREWFPAVEVRQSASRDYPFGTLAAHALGYVGEVSESRLATSTNGDLERGEIVGKTGVERFYDDFLRGRRGWKFVVVNSLGRQLGEAKVGKAPQNGSVLRLSLDIRLQDVLDRAFGDEAGAAVFLDPWTGEILAITSAPAFDPNLFAGGISLDAWQAILEDPRRPLHDRAISSFYAPGSTFKVIMAVAGVETGAVTPSEAVTCQGAVQIYGRTFRCWKSGGHGRVRLHKALAESCNVYFYLLGKKLGIDAVHRYGSLFRLGEPTGVDLPGEEGAVLPSREWKERVHGRPWYPGDTISVAIGQGLLAVTPMQMARAISAVATGGLLPRPHLRADAGSESLRLPIRSSTWSLVQSALKDAVRLGTGHRAALKGISVAGKTGTAQVRKRSAGGTRKRLPKSARDHAWFVGYAPADHPRIAFAVVVEHGGHGGSAAAPIARKVLEAFFSLEKEDRRPPSGLQAGSEAGRGEVLRVRTTALR